MKDKTHIIAHDGTCVLQVYELYVGVLLYPFILPNYIIALMIPQKPFFLSPSVVPGEKKNGSNDTSHTHKGINKQSL